MLSASPRCPDSQASIALSDGARGPRAGRSSQPQPTAHFGPLAHSQWRMAATSAAMPSHLCRRYILSRSEEHTSELQSLMRISYAVFCLKKKKNNKHKKNIKLDHNT